MTEEPRLHDALQRLMKTLDEEVVKVLVTTSFRQLDAPVVSEAAESLHQPNETALQAARHKAREKEGDVLYKWLEATAAWMHQPEPPSN